MTDGLTEVGEHLISSTGIAMVSGVYDYTRDAKTTEEKDIQSGSLSVIYKSGLVLYFSLSVKVEPGEKKPYNCAEVLTNLRTELIYGDNHTTVKKKLRELYKEISITYYMTPEEKE